MHSHSYPETAEALRLLAAEDARQSKLRDLLETIREQIRLEVKPEHRPDGLFQNIQDAVYAMRGRTPLMDDAAITAPLSGGVAQRLPDRDAIATIINDRTMINDEGFVQNSEPVADAILALSSTQRLCAKCGSATKREEAFINGEIWCHPCADAIAMPIIKPGDAS